MRRRTLLPSVLAGAALLVGSATTLAATLKAGTISAVAVDGDVGDWSGVPVTYLENGPRVTAIAHDDRFLYLYFHFSDVELARRVLHSGAIIWLNPEDKHKADFGVRYRGTEAELKALREIEQGNGGAPQPGGAPPPTAPQQGAPPRGEPPRGEPPPERPPQEGPPAGDPDGATRRPARAPLGALEVIHKGAADTVIPGGAKPDGAAAACRFADGVFTYELRIPLADAGETAATAAPGKRVVAVGFQMGGPTPAERDAMHERAPDGGSAGGGPGGGGHSGGWGGGFGGHGGHGGYGGEHGHGGDPEGFDGARSMAPVWLDVDLVDTAAARAVKQ
jgi:hypothetical protein